jgi:hypothetical protein
LVAIHLNQTLDGVVVSSRCVIPVSRLAPRCREAWWVVGVSVTQFSAFLARVLMERGLDRVGKRTRGLINILQSP